jgi:hypothetical protein
MIRCLRTAAVALALFVLGPAGAVAFPASMGLPGAPACASAAATFDAFARLDVFGLTTISDSAGPSAAPGTGTGNAFAGEDGVGNDDGGTVGTATIPRDGSFTAAFDEDQDFSERSFLAPPTTGPPAA